MELKTFKEKAKIFHDVLIKLKDSSRDIIRAALLNETDNLHKAAISFNNLWVIDLQAAKSEVVNAFQAVKTDTEAQSLFNAEAEFYASVLDQCLPGEKEYQLRKFIECAPRSPVKMLSNL